MNKKGLTLVELIAVIAIIALLALIIYPQVTKLLAGSKTDTNSIQEKSIRDAAETYLADNIGTISFESNTAIVTLKTLVDGGYLSGTIKNTRNNRNYNLQSSIVTISRTGTSPNYSYTYRVTLVDE